MLKELFLKKLLLISIFLNISYFLLYSQNTDNCERAEFFNNKSHTFIDSDRDLSRKQALMGLQIATKYNCFEQKAEALKLLGAHAIYRGELDSARRYLMKSLSIFNSIKMIKGVASCYLNLGSLYLNESNYNKSIDFFNKCLEKAKEINNKELISAAENNKGMVYHHQGFYKEAINHYKNSLEIDKSLKDEDGVVSCLCNLGTAYDMLGEYVVALSYYYQALQLSKKVNNLYKQGKLYNNIGKVFLSTKNYKLAYEYLNTAILIRDEIEDKAGLIITLFNFAELYNILELHEKEAEINQKTLKLAEEINDLQAISVCFYNIGCNLLKTNYINAKMYFIESLKLADSIEDYSEQYNNLIELVPLSYNEGKYSEAQFFFDRLKYIHDSIIKVEQLRGKNIALYDKKSKKNLSPLLISLLLLFLGSIAIVWVYKSKNKKKINDKTI